MSSWRYSSRGGGSTYRGGGYRGPRSDSYRGSRGSLSSRGSFTHSTPRYNSSGSSSSRYMGGGDDYRKTSYRGSSPSYSSSRDYSHHDDSSRKRIRTDSYSQGGSRRVHEVDDYRTSRYNSYSESEDKRVYKKPRPSEHRPKEEFRRKELPPPSPPRTRPSFRGRSLRGRRGIPRRDILMSRHVDRSLGYNRSTSELLRLRKLKIIKLKRLRERAALKAETDAEKKKKKTETKDDKTDEAKSDGEKKEVKKEDGEVENEKDDGNEKKVVAEAAEEEADEEQRTDYFGNPFLKLECPHCHVKTITFKEYIDHLYRPLHTQAMKDKSIQLKATLAKMRLAQREEQKKTEEEDVTSMTTTTIFCPICKLNYSQEKIIHQSSETHKKMKNFLLPYCKVCRISFKSPMLYEAHVCSLEHIKRKHKFEERNKNPSYLDHFMVLDSVGSVEDEIEDDDTKKDDVATNTEKAVVGDEEDLNLGSEYIHYMRVLYCEVCRTYLPRLTSKTKNINMHCQSKTHLKCYLKFGTDDLLAKIKKDEAKEIKAEQPADTSAKTDLTLEEVKKEEDIEDDIDEKTWADVDLLDQVTADDEDEEEGGRYDRFKSNENKENEGIKENGEEKATEVKSGPVEAAPAAVEQKTD